MAAKEPIIQAGNFDFVIVGGGTAGCLLANRLSASRQYKVLLLEAGGRDNYLWIHVPVGYLFTINNPLTDWRFNTEIEEGLNGRTLLYPRGKVLGGCSSINGMIYMRGQARDYDHWRQLGNVGWGWNDVLPHFKKTENYIHGPDEVHGVDGEWRVEEPRLSWEILDAFRESAALCGIPKIDDFNRGNNEGCGYFQVNQRRGVRWNTARAFLKPMSKNKNLQILTDAQATRLLFDGRKTVGVEFWRHGHKVQVSAGKEVILTAGAIGSPQLLQLSGVGPGETCRNLNIPLVHELSGVGQNLQDHLQLRLVHKVSGTKTLNERMSGIIGRIAIGMDYLFFRRGPMTMAPSQLGAFAKSDETRDTPNLQYHVQPLSLDKFGQPLHKFPAFTSSVCNLRPESRGYVQLRSPNAFDAPIIKPNYLSADVDKKIAADSIRLTRRIIDQSPLQKFSPQELKPGKEVLSQENLIRAAGDIGTTIFHPVGTAKMGNDALAVVNSELKVNGIEKLRVVDASVMPTITSGNTNSPVLMIAEKAATMILLDVKD